MRTLLVTLALSFLALTAGLPYEEKDYDYEADNENNEIENDADSAKVYPTPIFTTESSNMMVNEGDTVRLPCIVDRLEGFVMLWKRSDEIVTVANQIIDQEVRLEELKNGNYLILSQVTPEDAGRYTCQISAFNPTEIHHDLVVRTRPELEVAAEEINVVEGQPLSLQCSLLSGSPQPQLSLVSPDQVDLTPHLTVTKERLEVEVAEVSREMAGQYRCTADNGFSSEPTSREMTVNVEYPPEIQISESFILTDLAEEQEILCRVDSFPPVLDVDWALDGQPLTLDTPELVMSSTGEMFSLTIPEVRLNSTGEYSCTATNRLGSKTATALVTGEARPARIVSSGESEEEESYHLVWTVTSKAIVTGYTVSVRQKGEGHGWVRYEVGVSLNDTEADTEDEAEEYTGELELTDLTPGTTYEVTVGTNNTFGLKDHGDIFTFTTAHTARSALEQEGDGESQGAVTTALASDLRPLLTPIFLSLLLAL